jgi:hypothetical protein
MPPPSCFAVAAAATPLPPISATTRAKSVPQMHCGAPWSICSHRPPCQRYCWRCGRRPRAARVILVRVPPLKPASQADTVQLRCRLHSVCIVPSSHRTQYRHVVEACSEAIAPPQAIACRHLVLLQLEEQRHGRVQPCPKARHAPATCTKVGSCRPRFS